MDFSISATSKSLGKVPDKMTFSRDFDDLMESRVWIHSSRVKEAPLIFNFLRFVIFFNNKLTYNSLFEQSPVDMVKDLRSARFSINSFIPLNIDFAIGS